jgi:hypothetical protein
MQNQPAAQGLRKSADVLPFRRKPARTLAIVPISGFRTSGLPTSGVPLPGPHQGYRAQGFRAQGFRAHDDFARFEQERDEPINERQRMLMNLIALGIVVALITVGVWIADTIQVSVKQEDCLLQGRTNCAPIEMPAQR